MAAGGYRVRPDRLCADADRLDGIADAVLATVTDPLTPPSGVNTGFSSAEALHVVGEYWEAETCDLSEALRTARRKLRDTAAEYDRVDLSCAVTFRNILRGC